MKFLILFLMLSGSINSYSQDGQINAYDLVKLDIDFLQKLSAENPSIIGEIPNHRFSNEADFDVRLHYLSELQGLIILSKNDLLARYEFEKEKFNLDVSEINKYNYELSFGKVYYDSETENIVYQLKYFLGTEKMTINQVFVFFFHLKNELNMFKLFKK